MLYRLTRLWSRPGSAWRADPRWGRTACRLSCPAAAPQTSRPAQSVVRRFRWLLVPALLASGIAHAAPGTDLLVNMNQVPADGTGPAGGNFQYEVVVRHNTGGPATGALLTNLLPVGATFVSATSPDGVTCSQVPAPNAVVDGTNGTALCQVGSVAVNASKRVIFTVVLPTVGSGWSNAATVTHDDSNTDPNRANDTSSRAFTVYDAADMRIAVVAVPEGSVGNPLRPGQPYQYEVDVTNAGPSGVPSAGRTVVTFQVPVGMSITSAGTNGWVCSPASFPLTSSGGGQPNVEVSCTRPGAVAGNNAAVPRLVVGAVANSLGAITTSFNVAAFSNATTAMPDGQPNNNTQPVTVNTAGNGADMSLTKAVINPGNGNVLTNPAIAVGEEVTFRLRPRFNGGMLQVGDLLTVTDTLPAGLDFVSVTGTGWVCSNLGPNVSCARTLAAPLPANNTNLDDIRLVATVTGVAGSRSNSADIAEPSLSGDPELSNNDGTVLFSASTLADLSVNKSASNYQNGVNVAVPLNTNFTYTLSARNNGPLNLPAGMGIELKDEIPVGVTIMGVAAGAGWTCVPSTPLPMAGPGTVTCAYNAALNNGLTTSDIVLTAQRTTTGIATNNACVAYPVGTTSRTETNFANNCRGVGVGADDSTDPNDRADLSVTKGFSAGPTYVGDNLTYTLTVSNLGPAIARNVQLRDVLSNLISSAGQNGLVAIDTVGAPGAACTPSAPANVTTATLICALGNIPSGQTRTVTVTVRPAIARTGSRPNTVYAYAQETVDPNLDNNFAPVSSQVIARVDLVASKAASPTTAAAGQLIGYTVAATNNGPSDALDVWLRDQLPGGAALVGTPVASNGGSCAVVNNVLECRWNRAAAPGTVNNYLQPGGRYEVNYQMRSINNEPWTPPRALNNTVTVGTATDEPNQTNNTANATVTLTRPELDVLVTMNHSADPIDLGADTVYTIRVTNSGPSYGTNVVMTDTFPTTNSGGDPSSATFSYQGSLTVDDPTKGSCTAPAVGATSGSLQCTFPLMAAGETRVITFRMRAESLPAGAASGSIFHRAVVTVTETEFRSGVDVVVNNSTHDQTTTRRAAPAPGSAIDLGIVKTTSTARALPGTEFDYTLTVTNLSQAGRDVTPANGAQVLDTLPAGLNFVSAPGCVYTAGTRQLSCAISSLAAGANAVFTLRARVDAPYTGTPTVNNTACVDIPGDPVAGNNCSTVPKTVGPPPPSSIPTLSEWGLILLSALLGLMAWRHWVVQRRRY